jgi:transposase
MDSIQELTKQGVPIKAIARQLGIARNTVKKYQRGPVTRAARLVCPSKLEPYADVVRRWVFEDHLYNCVTMLERLQELGYTGGITQLKAFVHPLRPPQRGKRPIVRYETAPGEQMQFDWGEFTYTDEQGHPHKVYGFIATLSYSRMRFVTFVKRADTPSLLRCLMAACEYFGGLPHAFLTDRMKSVLLAVVEGELHWHPQFRDFATSLGVTPRVCKAYTPQTKGKVERSVGVIKASFWAGVRFADIADLNQQAEAWCERNRQTIHATTRCRPLDRWAEEQLRPLPTGWAWERWGCEPRKVTWDGYVSYDGVLYGLPQAEQVAGTQVEVRERYGLVTIWQQGRCLLEVPKRAQSGESVPHPDQFRTMPTAAQAVRLTTPVGHQIAPPAVETRDLADYDRWCGVSA